MTLPCHAASVPQALSAEELALFDHVPRDQAARTRVILVPFLAPGTGAMTLGRLVLLRRRQVGNRFLMAHELVHVRQWSELGVVGFLRRYLGSYTANLWRLRRHRPAYLAIPLEVEAREGARAWDERRGMG